MSELKQLPTLTREQLEAIAGGECSASDWLTALDQLKEAYESLIDLTSYVIERVSGS